MTGIVGVPTTDMDLGVRGDVWNLLSSLKSRGKTVLLATHYMEEADILSERLVLCLENSTLQDSKS